MGDNFSSRFLNTKFQPAFVPSHYLSRARLLEQLSPQPDTQLTVIVGPAGSGKSTLLADH